MHLKEIFKEYINTENSQNVKKPQPILSAPRYTLFESITNQPKPGIFVII